MKLPIEIIAMIEKMAENADEIVKAADGLFPFLQGAIEGTYEDEIKHKLNINQKGYFESVIYRLKDVFYVYQKIENLDEEYLRFINLCISKNEFRDQYFQSEENLKYLLYPSFEDFEFGNILMKGKSCLDCYSMAIGSKLFNKRPDNIKGLKNLLSSSTDVKAKSILSCIEKCEPYLVGIILDPGIDGKKSLRDIYAHHDGPNVSFFVSPNEQGSYTSTSGAIINMHDRRIPLLQNYLVKNIAGDTWFYLFEIVRNTFSILSDK